MGLRECRNCDRTTNIGVYCQHCAGEIMAKAPNSHPITRRKRAPGPCWRLSQVSRA